MCFFMIACLLPKHILMEASNQLCLLTTQLKQGILQCPVVSLDWQEGSICKRLPTWWEDVWYGTLQYIEIGSFPHSVASHSCDAPCSSQNSKCAQRFNKGWGLLSARWTLSYRLSIKCFIWIIISVELSYWSAVDEQNLSSIALLEANKNSRVWS